MKKTQDATLFAKYPDVVTAKQLCSMLGGIGIKSVYKCLHNGEIKSFKIGKGFRIPKRSVIEYLNRKTEN